MAATEARLGLLEQMVALYLLTSLAVQEAFMPDLAVGRTQYRLVMVTPLGVYPVTGWLSTTMTEDE